MPPVAVVAVGRRRGGRRGWDGAAGRAERGRRRRGGRGGVGRCARRGVVRLGRLQGQESMFSYCGDSVTYVNSK